MNTIRILKLLLTITLIISCGNDDDQSTNPIDQLPAATQTGANTFGCLLDGKAFLPRGGTNPLDCVYQFVNGGYYFALQGNKRDFENNYFAISCSTENLEILDNQTYNLIENGQENAFGRYTFNTLDYFTSQTHTGELTITKLDQVNQVVSGTFWFDVIDSNGTVHQIREGRFDMQYTQ